MLSRARLLAVATLFVATALPVLAFTVPPAPPRFVHDGAGLLSQGERRALEHQLLTLDRERGLQIGVAILPSLEGEPLEEATLAIAEAWRPGSAERSDGLLLAIYLAERKVRIEVGYGLEGAIPDAFAGRVIRQRIAPAFRQRQFGAGLQDAVGALAAAAEGETVPPPRSSGGGGGEAGSRGAIIPSLFLLFMAVLFLRRVFGSRSHTLGRRGSDLPWWLLLLGSGRSSRGGGGGGFGGFGGLGGGGFGGGSFGGGGASGGW